MSKRRDELINLIQKAEYIEKGPTEGLSTEEVELRKKQGFVNKTQKKVTKSIWQILADNVFTFFNFIYIIIAILMAYAKLPYSNFLFLIPVGSSLSPTRKSSVLETEKRLTLKPSRSFFTTSLSIRQEIKLLPTAS